MSEHRTLSLASAVDQGAVDAKLAGALVRSGAELVELTERFYRGLFLGVLGIVGVASVSAMALMPLRAGSAGVPVFGMIVGGLVLVLMPLALWRPGSVYLTLRRQPHAEIAIVLYAAVLVSAVFPLRSQLWWPSCALLMLVAVVAPIGRVLTYCLGVLSLNVLAHVATGDLDRTPAVSIVGLWIGYIFWSLTVAAVSDQLAAYLMRLNSPAARGHARPPLRVRAWVSAEPDAAKTPGLDGGPAQAAAEAEAGPSDAELGASNPSLPVDAQDPTQLLPLTARQLQVLALMIDGHRYRTIAACLAISEGRVQRLVAQAVERAGLHSPAELVAVAVSLGLAPASGAGANGAASHDGPSEAIVEADDMQ